MKLNSTYRLRFFLDYGSGGCLWPDNEAAYSKYDLGPLDTPIYDMNGDIIQEAKIELPERSRLKVLELDKLLGESLDKDNPGGPSLWGKSEWDHFYNETHKLFNEIKEFMGDDFVVLYKQP